MQDTEKTLQIYEEALYPYMREHGLRDLVEDNASPHNNQKIRDAHKAHNIVIVGYSATEAEKDQIKELIRQQTARYKPAQDQSAQLTKQTRELARLPAWPPNSPDLNLIEIVWAWMVELIIGSNGGWPSAVTQLKTAVLQAWDDVNIDTFRELVRSYRTRLLTIESVGGGRHPAFA